MVAGVVEEVEVVAEDAAAVAAVAADVVGEVVLIVVVAEGVVRAEIMAAVETGA